MNYDKETGKVTDCICGTYWAVVEDCPIHPSETHECYYPEDWASRDSRNDIKEIIDRFVKECKE